MNSQTRFKLEKILKSVVNIRPVYSNDVQSRRIEGQFGGETMKEVFSEINFYLQYTPPLLNYNVLKDIVNQCHYTCKKINAGEPKRISCYLFNDINNGIRLINKNVFLRQNDEKESFIKEIREFSVGEDIRTLNRLAYSTNVADENSLCIFITDNLGCELSDILKSKNRNISKQSLWILVDGEHIEVKNGIPVKL